MDWVHKLTRVYLNIKSNVLFTMWPVVFQRKLLLDKRIVKTEEMFLFPVVAIVLAVFYLNNDKTDFVTIVIIINYYYCEREVFTLHFALRNILRNSILRIHFNEIRESHTESFPNTLSNTKCQVKH